MGHYHVRHDPSTTILLKERALTSFGDVQDTTAAVDAATDNLGAGDEPELQTQYTAEAQRMEDIHDPADVI